MIWHILFLKALWPLKSQKWLDRIFSKCIFLKALDLNQVPMGVRAMAQTENLTAVGLGCGLKVPNVIAKNKQKYFLAFHAESKKSFLLLYLCLTFVCKI